jgi:hypothetical protein
MDYMVYLSPNQKEKLKVAYRNKTDCSLRIEPKVGNQKLRLSQTQVKKLRDARANKKACEIKLSRTQIQQSGGFILPFLAAAAPFIARTLGGLAVSSGAKELYNKIRGKGLGTMRRTQRGKGYILPFMLKN